jgi:excisionase family DNA binding protein
MSKQLNNFDSGDHASEAPSVGHSSRITVEEIGRRLNIGRQAVYAMLEQQILPGIRLGRRWIITRHAYEAWERTCGTRTVAGLERQTEVTVLN